MSNPAVTPQAAASAVEPGLSEGARIVNTFTTPTKTFSDLKRKPSWFVPFILLCGFSYALIFAAAQKIGWEQITENQMRMNHKRMEQIENMPAEQQASARELGVKITKGFSYGFPIVLLVVVVIVSAVLMAIFNFGLGAEITFSQSLAVNMYARLPGIIKVVLAVISIYAGAAPENFIFQEPVASSLGALVDPAQHLVLFSFLSYFDVFAIWILILSGIGYSCVSKVKRGTAIGVLAGCYLLWILLQTGVATLAA